ncbi:unnamed protein product [Cyclocybe aegerita]|uniref:Uncharacterized protein n=1 Tax=Cyclocybe aegerita TaxID=1973307 RepID=A0A8S0WMD3_CYCAE|nr:unnamed protein product [Cyclocybe aegerita]
MNSLSHFDSYQPCLPPEILDLFVDALYDCPYINSKSPTLRACSLVSRAFAARARKYLFERVDLRVTTETIEQAEDIYEIMSWTPRALGSGGHLSGIAPFIRVLSVDIWCAQRSVVVRAENVLSAIFQGLHGPEHGIEDLFLSYEEVWGNIGLGLRHSLSDLLRSPRLKTLSLTGFLGLPTMLLVGSRIEDLTLDSIESDDQPCFYSSRYPVHERTYPQLKHLSVRLTDSDHVIPLLETSTTSALNLVSEFSASIDTDDDYMDLVPLLRRMEKTLQTISLNFGSGTHIRTLITHYLNFDAFPDSYFQPEYLVPVDLSKMPNLTEIQFTYDGSSEVSYSDGLRITIILLSMLCAPPSLHTLDMTFITDHTWSPDDPSLPPLIKTLTMPAELNGWTELNGVIAEMTMVKKVVMTICTISCKGNEEATKELSERVERLMRTAMPHFSGTGKVPELVLQFPVADEDEEDEEEGNEDETENGDESKDEDEDESENETWLD